MPNTKAIGVAFADPQFDSLSVTGNTGLYGETPVAQAAAIAAVTDTASGAELATAINAIRVALQNIGITA